MTTLNNRPTDDVGFAFMCFFAVAGAIVVLSLGPVALVGAVLPWLLVWLFGRASIAVLLLFVGGAALGALAYLGYLMPAVSIGHRALLGAGSYQNMVSAWAALATRVEIIPTALAAGITIGSVARLTAADQSNAPLSTEQEDPAPAPIARLRAKRNSSSAVHGDGTLLGADAQTGRALALSDADANHHVIIAGATGTGKTVTGTNIIQSHIERGFPIVFLDGKGDVDLGRRIKRFAEEAGRSAYIFHHHFADGTDDACAYNPITAQDFTALANLVTTLRPYNEPHYEILQKGFMQTVTKVAKAIGEPLDLLTLGDLLSVNAMTAAIRKNKHKIPNAQELLVEVQDQRAAEKEGVESLAGVIQNLARSSMAPLFDTKSGRPVLKLSEARETGAVVYFALPALVYPDLAKNLGQLIINDIRLTLGSGTRPWLIVLDEISTYSGQQILSLVNQGRSFGARVVLLGQSFADLETVDNIDGAAFRNQILASVNTVIVHRLNSPDDAELAAQIAGTYLKPEVTAQTVGNQPTGAGSVRMTREFHVGPDRFKSLKRGEAIVLSKYGQPVRKIKARLSNIMK